MDLQERAPRYRYEDDFKKWVETRVSDARKHSGSWLLLPLAELALRDVAQLEEIKNKVLAGISVADLLKIFQAKLDFRDENEIVRNAREIISKCYDSPPNGGCAEIKRAS